MAFKRLAEKISRFRRGLQRRICGKSNEKTIVTGQTVVVAGGMALPVDITAIVSKTGIQNQLEFEKSQAVLTGPERDVDNIRRLDAMIGKLMKPFNGAARAPEKTITKIERHVSDIADSLRRASAYRHQPGAVAGLFDESGKINFIWELEYINVFPGPAGEKIEQKIAKIRLGQ